MRRLEYEILPAMGPGTQRKSGSLRDLVLSIPYLFAERLVPPLTVLNSILRDGIADAGMSGGCQWPPFEITPVEYDELVRSFVTGAEDDLRTVDTPDWVKTRSDWTIWVMHLTHDVPVAEHRRLMEEYERLERDYKQAMKSGNSELVEDLFVDAAQAGARLSDFVMSSMGKGRKKGRR